MTALVIGGGPLRAHARWVPTGHRRGTVNQSGQGAFIPVASKQCQRQATRFLRPVIRTDDFPGMSYDVCGVGLEPYLCCQGPCVPYQ